MKCFICNIMEEKERISYQTTNSGTDIIPVCGLCLKNICEMFAIAQPEMFNRMIKVFKTSAKQV